MAKPWNFNMRTERDKYLAVAIGKRPKMFNIYSPENSIGVRIIIAAAREERWADEIAAALNEFGVKQEKEMPVPPGFVVTAHVLERWGERVRRNGATSLAGALTRGVLTKTTDGADVLVSKEADALFYLQRDGEKWVVKSVVRLSAIEQRQ